MLVIYPRHVMQVSVVPLQVGLEISLRSQAKLLRLMSDSRQIVDIRSSCVSHMLVSSCASIAYEGGRGIEVTGLDPFMFPLSIDAQTFILVVDMPVS